MGLLEGSECVTPRLNQILYDDCSGLRRGRTRENAQMEFFPRSTHLCSRSFAYTNNRSKDYLEAKPVQMYTSV